MGSREKDQADFDLEKCFELFDQALTSRDERVINALRGLLMIVALTAPETDDRTGPLRRMRSDIHNLTHTVHGLTNTVNEMSRTITDLGMTIETLRQRWNVYGGGSGGGDFFGSGLSGRYSSQPVDSKMLPLIDLAMTRPRSDDDQYR